LITTSARRDAEPSRWPRRQAVKASGIHAVAVATGLALLAAASPADAAYWYGGWYGGGYKHRSAHKAHKTKSADNVGKESPAEVPKGPLQIFISINQQKLHLYGGGVHIADTSIATGVADHPTPLGVFSIIQKQVFHRSNIYSNAPMPFMQRVTWSGVAMHEGQNIGHPASHGCIRLPRDFAIRLYRLTKLGTLVIIARSELKPTEFADPHLFVHKEKAPEIAAAPVNGVETAAARPAELAAQASGASTAAAPVLGSGSAATDVPAIGGVDPKPAAIAAPANPAAPADGNAAPAPPTPADLAKAAAAKKLPVAIFISRKRQRLYVRQNFEPLFDAPITIAQPDTPLGTHVFTALEFTGPDRTTLRWNVVSLPGEAVKRVRYVEERSRSGKTHRRAIEDERVSDLSPPQTAAQVLARIEIPTELIEAIAQMIVPNSSLVVSDQGLGDETGEGTDFVVVTH
jgi:lipoprotein-anchoring transpeptidase ErfK/SrfK